METRFAEQNVRWELLEWGQHHTPPIQLRCMAIALDLTRLASEPDNPTFRRETMKRIARLEEAVRTENATATLGYLSGSDKPPRQQHETEHRPPQMAELHRRCWPSFLASCLLSIGIQLGSTVATPRRRAA